jgi:hypothetical protein
MESVNYFIPVLLESPAPQIILTASITEVSSPPTSVLSSSHADFHSLTSQST